MLFVSFIEIKMKHLISFVVWLSYVAHVQFGMSVST